MQRRATFRLLAALGLGIVLFWVLPVPYSRVGGVGNYDCCRVGLLGWAHVETLQQEFRPSSAPPDPRVEFDRSAIIWTAAASVLWLCAAVWWSRRRKPDQA